ncbi:MAG: biopolymer transporter ExbD [Pseudomonadota bacterium]
MARGRGHRAGLESIGTELNLVPYLDMMTVLVLFLLVTITSFLSFTMLNASIPQLAPDSPKAAAQVKKAQLLLMVRVTKAGYVVDPNVQGGASMRQVPVPKAPDGTYNFLELTNAVGNIKTRFADETRVLIISEPNVVYDDIVHTMDAVRERTAGAGDLFPDVTLSIF